VGKVAGSEQPKGWPTPANLFQADDARRSERDELQDRLRVELDRVAMLEDIVHACADGEMRPAQRYLAAGLLGAKQCEMGSMFIWFAAARNGRPLHVPAGRTCWRHRIARGEQCHARRLYVLPDCADHITIEHLVHNYKVHLQGRFPAELFSKRYGSPLLDLQITSYDNVELRFINTSDQPQRFAAAVVGTPLPPVP
jgi:hypothetical protein